MNFSIVLMDCAGYLPIRDPVSEGVILNITTVLLEMKIQH